MACSCGVWESGMRIRRVVSVGMRDVETVIERITACLRLEASAGAISAASWRGTVGLRGFDTGSS